MKTNENDRWLASQEVLERVTQIVGSRARALILLNERLASESWKARAEYGYGDLDYGPLPKGLPTTSAPWPHFVYRFADKHVAVPPRFWDTSLKSIWGIDLWNWSNGTFSSVTPLSGGLISFEDDDRWFIQVPTRWTAFKVSFEVKSVDDFIRDLTFSKKIVLQPESKPRNKKRPWAIILARLESEVENGGIKRFGDPDVYGTQAKVEDAIREAMANETGDEPPPSTVRAKAQAIMKLWRQSIT